MRYCFHVLGCCFLLPASWPKTLLIFSRTSVCFSACACVFMPFLICDPLAFFVSTARAGAGVRACDGGVAEVPHGRRRADRSVRRRGKPRQQQQEQSDKARPVRSWTGYPVVSSFPTANVLILFGVFACLGQRSSAVRQ